MRFVRNLSIGSKLALSGGCALVLLGFLAVFALNGLTQVNALQTRVASAAQQQRQIAAALLAAEAMLNRSQDVRFQQSVADVNHVVAAARQDGDTARTLLGNVQAGQENQTQRDTMAHAMAALDGVNTLIERAQAMRATMLDTRQRHLFMAQPIFEDSVQDLSQELMSGDTPTGVAGVTAAAPAAGSKPVVMHQASRQALGDYQLSMAHLLNAALMFMATDNPAIGSQVREAVPDTQAKLKALLDSGLDDQVKGDAVILGTLGGAIGQAAIDLVHQAALLNTFSTHDLADATRGVRQALDQATQTISAQVESARVQAVAASAQARQRILTFAAIICVVLLGSAWLTARAIARPIGTMTKAVQAMANGETGMRIGFANRRDEVGRMAAALEALRHVIRQAFVQSQIIEQLPIGVTTADAGNDMRISYLNPATKTIMESVAEHLPVPVADILGQSIDIFHQRPEHQRALLADPANLPCRARVHLGTETLELNVSAIMDGTGHYVGPMLTWTNVTNQTQLVAQFKASVGTIAETVSSQAAQMKDTASGMADAASDAGQRTATVAAASDQASANVHAVAASAEELAASVAEISRQVAESANIADQAVREAAATDQCVTGLSEAAGRIGDVVRLISDIAGRTNLLALNATIEAARAGEAGKGFAVVASEVKTLATQTARATEEIGAQISAMQGATGQAVTALRSIGETIQRMSEIATAIAGAVEEQGAATQEIARAVQQAAAGTSEVTNNIALVTGSVEQTRTQAGDVLDAATALGEQSHKLKEDVATFLAAVQKAA